MTWRWLAILGLLLVSAVPLQARTITLTGEDCDRMAVISARAPRVSWAAQSYGPGVFYTYPQVQLFPEMAVLIRFPLDKVPKGQRITKAELSVTSEYVAGTPNVSVRRILADWGPGVCHLYYRTIPKKLKWTEPGGRGAGTDRAAKDSGVFRMDKAADYTTDVTEDVELWYTGATANRGWILLIDNNSGPTYLSTPCPSIHASGNRWKLQITFEPQ
jgi:hypothetical protein